MNIRVVRNKIKSVTNVKKITQAMQLVSAIKMKKAQIVATEGKPYQEFVEKSIRRFTQKIDPKLSPLLINKEGGETLFLLISSNKGLCGAFNVNLFRFILQNYNLRNKNIVTIGKKGAILARHLGANIVADFSASNSQESVSAVFSFILE
ncbi:F0F1 ATP synthase subunit gamma [Candidatus Roizmanbacteria bacterium]|nr:F0F1 ATP synthase subunit gamma [Candidatus Roizmanbacteria bacterium]